MIVWNFETSKPQFDDLIACSFRSVVVITFASHAKGPLFETGRKHAVAANVLETNSLSVA